MARRDAERWCAGASSKEGVMSPGSCPAFSAFARTMAAKVPMTDTRTRVASLTGDVLVLGRVVVAAEAVVVELGASSARGADRSMFVVEEVGAAGVQLTGQAINPPSAWPQNRVSPSTDRPSRREFGGAEGLD